MADSDNNLEQLYGGSIQEFLKNSDLSTISTKKVRQYLQQKYNITSIDDIKSSLNSLIESKFMALQPSEEAEPEAAEEDNSSSELSELIEDKKRKKGSKLKMTKKTKTGKKEKKKRKVSNDGPKKLNGFNAPQILSPKLAKLLNHDRLPRTGVIKELWVYIKKHQLQDPKDGRKINCDEQLKELFELDSITSFQMSKLIGPHLTKLSEDEMQKLQEEINFEFFNKTNVVNGNGENNSVES
ncbi:SWIB-domain-containing protein [Neoconidiobolus thromboides FSU 785]|nr:SWIB-domain-containing protein [Neoconidiobolus thromboides FSU 785]